VRETFSKQSSIKKPTIVVRRILNLIENGELLPGEKLQSELKIGRQTDINRGSVRGVLSTLVLMVY